MFLMFYICSVYVSCSTTPRGSSRACRTNAAKASRDRSGRSSRRRARPRPSGRTS